MYLKEEFQRMEPLCSMVIKKKDYLKKVLFEIEDDKYVEVIYVVQCKEEPLKPRPNNIIESILYTDSIEKPLSSLSSTDRDALKEHGEVNYEWLLTKENLMEIRTMYSKNLSEYDTSKLRLTK
ncbi:hypothetical protein [Bacillus altitudinis]|uniref:hypothetical protein n=1 Tax=Bacillus altitudinis TaxID=293387 RepID=UPI001C222C9E|nr:hypothetical protein [Bacillus altitudinis]MBU8855199.1 hypothetical protein [Bacillus sp. FJAT-26377]MCY7454250.1 hypothetical protein [Bacillus altitudinis]